jgi:hypothetical protein
MARITTAARRTEAAIAALSVIEHLRFHERHRRDRRHHQLGDPVAAPDGERLGPVVDEDHPHLAAIIGIDRTRRVEHRHPVVERQSRARPHLPLVAGRQGEREPAGDRRPLAGPQHDRFARAKRGEQVRARRARRLRLGRGEAPSVFQPPEADGDGE